jgi:hypothetical protein
MPTSWQENNLTISQSTTYTHSPLVVSILTFDKLQGGSMPVKIPVPSGLILTREKVVEPKPIKRRRRKTAQEKAKTRRGRAARAKGHGFEREVAIKFRVNGYPDACRNLEYQFGTGIDIANTGIYDIQCKRKKKNVPMSAIKEVPRKEGRVPVLIAKTDFCETLVTLPLDHFMELIKKV